MHVALFRRAWIEINVEPLPFIASLVALFRRAWIEILNTVDDVATLDVALFRRAWIEIEHEARALGIVTGRSLQESVD